MYFTLTRRLYRAGQTQRLCFLPNFPVEISASREYCLRIAPFSGLTPYALAKRGVTLPEDAASLTERTHALSVEGGALTLEIAFPQEDRYTLHLLADGKEVEAFQVYALEDDLYARTPLKGDGHMHTFNSDGTESPELMAAIARRRGYDYVVVTDHLKYAPSLRAKQIVDPLGLSMRILPGEEVHSPGNPVHIINMGGRESVNEWFQQNPQAYEHAVEVKLREVSEALLPEDRYSAAASQVMFERIRAVDGVAVLCHPHWVAPDKFNENEDVTEYLFDHRAFDAFEAVAYRGSDEGTVTEASTQMQLAYARAHADVPAIGNSDSHKSLMMRNYTIVFAEGNTEDAVKRAVREGNCLACYDNKLFGPYRLVKYAYFWIENLFARHDEILEREGQRLMRHVSGSVTDEAALRTDAGKLEAYYRALRGEEA